jgi:uncharacterized protein (TIGR00369 family)
MRKYLPSFPNCFACGKENPRGIKLAIFEENGIIQAEFKPTEDLAGFPGIIHGGISCTLLDEIMWYASFAHSKKTVVTGEITVRLSKPLMSQGTYTISAEVIEKRKKYILVQGIIKEGNEIYCRASGKYFILPQEKDEDFKKRFKYQDVNGDLIPEKLRYII